MDSNISYHSRAPFHWRIVVDLQPGATLCRHRVA
jgi:hypothetical protein